MRTVSIIGYGRFGKTLHRLLGEDFKINIFHREQKDIAEIYRSDIIFYCVPISAFAAVIKKHRSYIQKYNVLIDVLSVKAYPKQVFDSLIKYEKQNILLTHPMFGPDSSKHGFEGLPIMVDQYRVPDEEYLFWKTYFSQKGLRVIEMKAAEHDKLAANSQGVTHFIGRLLEEFQFKSTPIDTKGAEKLHEVMEQTCNDTWELFMNLQNYNNYTKRMRVKLGKAYDKLYNKLLPRRVNSKKIIFGIQGGRGSFNEAALMEYVKSKNIGNYKVKYLYTTEKVLRNLNKGNIDFGLFAIYNTIGGIVDESTYAMARYKFKIVYEFAISIAHCLMKRKDVPISLIQQIMAHPQVLKQCARTLSKKYVDLKQVSGSGDLVDTAKAAWALAKGTIDKNTYILGPKILSNIYNFEVVDENLQDSEKNLTSFFLVSR
ncbi:MAG: prephenate dehydrogenase/arogenate dehydrogenase family protein [Patescibacteria group bacterium]